MALKTQQELYNEFIIELQSLAPELSDTNDGSIIDLLAGAISQAVYESNIVALEEIKKTYFSTANGPEITGSVDDLEYLAVDHFGDQFKRPLAVKAIGVVNFSRPNADAGNVIIPAGTVVKTSISSFGSVVSFKTTSTVTMTGLSINAQVEALEAGTSGNVNSGTVTSIESALTDSSITVNNSVGFSGGKETENDAQYRESIKLLLQTIKGATLDAIEAKAKTVAGVVYVKGIEELKRVIEWDEATLSGVGNSFYLPIGKLYVADANGSSSDALISAVQSAIADPRAAGVEIKVYGAVAFPMNWHVSYTLNPSGSNYSTLVNDDSMVKDFMRNYINSIPIGVGFSKTQANTALLNKFGPSGTNDITSVFTLSPTGDIFVTSTQKLISNVVSVG